jgi:hypothetical protein
VRRDERLLLDDRTVDHRINFRVLRLDRRLASGEQRDLPVAARTRPLAADDELAGFPVRADRVGDDGRHHGADEADAHDDHDFLAFRAGRGGERLHARELTRVVFRCGQREFLAGGADGVAGHECRS